MSEVPGGWESAKLKDVVELRTGPFGSSLHQSDYVDGGIPIVNPMHIEEGRIQPSQKHRVSEETAERLSEFRLSIGDVVLGRRGEMGRCAVVQANQVGWLCGTGSLIVRPGQGIASDFLQGLLSSDAVVKHLAAESVGTTMVNLNQRILLDLDIVIPPRQEQIRIVEKLEELLSDLDAGVAELRAAQRKLAQYRQSLLKAAVEGALTADWRAAHGQPQETGAELLQRILSERRARWEQKQLAKFAEQGKTPPKGWQDKYLEPVAPNFIDLPPLPEGWAWASLGQLLESMTSGSRDWAPYYDRGVCTFVMAQNVRPWRPDFTFRQLVDPPLNDRDRARSKVEKDDLLITIVGANTGQCCRVPQELEAHFVCQSVALLRATEKSMSEFLNAALNSSEHGQRQFREMNYGAGRPHLSFEQIESVLVPVPPAAEQEQMLSVIEEGARQMENIEAEIAKALKQTTAQRKNLLRAAFSGQLVPQDPSDEPASELLARIRAARASNDGAAPRRRRRSA